MARPESAGGNAGLPRAVRACGLALVALSALLTYNTVFAEARLQALSGDATVTVPEVRYDGAAGEELALPARSTPATASPDLLQGTLMSVEALAVASALGVFSLLFNESARGEPGSDRERRLTPGPSLRAPRTGESRSRARAVPAAAPSAEGSRSGESLSGSQRAVPRSPRQPLVQRRYLPPGHLGVAQEHGIHQTQAVGRCEGSLHGCLGNGEKGVGGDDPASQITGEARTSGSAGDGVNFGDHRRGDGGLELLLCPPEKACPPLVEGVGRMEGAHQDAAVQERQGHLRRRDFRTDPVSRIPGSQVSSPSRTISSRVRLMAGRSFESAYSRKGLGLHLFFRGMTSTPSFVVRRVTSTPGLSPVASRMALGSTMRPPPTTTVSDSTSDSMVQCAFSIGKKMPVGAGGPA